MDGCAGAGKNGSPRRERLPVVITRSAAEMGSVFDAYEDLLRGRAEHFLGTGTAEVDEALARSKQRALESPVSSHAVGDLVQIVRDICRTIVRRRAREPQQWTDARARGIAVIPRIGPVEGPVAEAVERLTPLQRRRLLDAAAGVRGEPGKTTAFFNLRVHHARQRIRELMRQAGHTPPAVILLAFRRLRLSTADVFHLPVTAALAPVVMWSLFGGSTGFAPPGASPPSLVPAFTVASHDAPQPVRRQPELATSHVAVTRPAAPGVEPLAKPAGHRAADETPEDVRISTAATPLSGNGAVVAIGWGNTCACQVLMRSLDAGATWTATDGPPTDTSQLVLPPDYPRDPRIFGGVTPYGDGAPYVAASFGAPFQHIAGLPAGLVAVSAGFDQGDQRIFSAALTGVWSLRLGATAPHEEIAYAAEPLTSNAIAALATPPLGGAAVLAWAPADSVIPGSLAPPSFDSELFGCATSCTPEGIPGNVPWRLSVAGSTILAYDRTSVSMSRDNGQTFTQISLPSDAMAVESAVLVGRSATPWLTIVEPAARSAVVALRPDGSWADEVGDAAALRSDQADLVQIDEQRVAALFRDAGYRCTVAGTGRWLPRCPAM